MASPSSTWPPCRMPTSICRWISVKITSSAAPRKVSRLRPAWSGSSCSARPTSPSSPSQSTASLKSGEMRGTFTVSRTAANVTAARPTARARNGVSEATRGHAADRGSPIWVEPRSWRAERNNMIATIPPAMACCSAHSVGTTCDSSSDNITVKIAYPKRTIRQSRGTTIRTAPIPARITAGAPIRRLSWRKRSPSDIGRHVAYPRSRTHRMKAARNSQPR